jgi:serine/threonine-protein kinase
MSTAASAEGRLRDGQTFARYRIVRLLGVGGMGAVYEAVHPVLKKRFALKTLLPELAQIPEARARFLREGEAAARIDHPNVVDVSDVGIEDETPYLVMEFLEGETLDDLLGRRGFLEVAEGIELLLPVASAVAAGHDHGVVHRDLKPQNVFLARDPFGATVPKVLDFGVSKLVGDGEGAAALTGTLAVLGTAAYMSPEQARGSAYVDGRSDQYALGLILYEMLTGARGHRGSNQLELIHNASVGAVVPARQLRPDLPDALALALGRMLEPAPEDRHPSLRAAGRALLPFARDSDRQRLAHLLAEPEARLAAQPADAAPAERAPPVSAGGTKLLPDWEPEPEPEPEPALTATLPGRRAWMAAAVAAVAVAVGTALALRSPAPQPALPAPPPTAPEPQPEPARPPAPAATEPPRPPAPPSPEPPAPSTRKHAKPHKVPRVVPADDDLVLPPGVSGKHPAAPPPMKPPAPILSP